MAVVPIDEPSEFLRPDEELEFFSYFEVVRHLGVQDAPAAEQARKVATWATGRDINEALRLSIKENGHIWIVPKKARVTA